MIKAIPTQKERNFNIDEMFFSRTDLKGKIVYGNDVFTSISGFKKEELIGAPHNIIRHPDMPKAVFKLLWDTIQAGQPIAAYVKNMANNGDHYWVLAAVYPVREEYISIRIKPSSDFLPVIQKVYEKMLTEEKIKNVAASSEILVETLKKSGFSNYQDFMTHFLFLEHKSRDKILVNERKLNNIVDINNKENMKIFEKIESLSQNSKVTFKALFNRIDGFQKNSTILQENIEVLLNEFRDLELISLNLRVLAANFGDEGLAMGKISSQFQSLASEIQVSLTLFSEVIQSSLKQMSESVFSICSMKIQTDMADFFIHELIKNLSAEKDTAENTIKTFEQNSGIFSELCRTSSRNTLKSLSELDTALVSVDRSTKEIKKYINGLDVVEKMASIEAGRVQKIREAIKDHIEHLTKFNETLRKTNIEIVKTVLSQLEVVEYMFKNITIIGDELDQSFNLATSYSQNALKA